MAQVTINVDEAVLRLVDDVARRVGLPREVVLARAVQQETAASVLTDLFQGREDGLTDDEAEQIVETERDAMRADHRGSIPPQR